MRARRRAAHLETIKRSDSPPANGYRTMAARRTADIGMREAQTAVIAISRALLFSPAGARHANKGARGVAV